MGIDRTHCPQGGARPLVRLPLSPRATPAASQGAPRETPRFASSLSHGLPVQCCLERCDTRSSRTEGDGCAPRPPGALSVRVDGLTCAAPAWRPWGHPRHHPASRPPLNVDEGG
jgi:hypothetical protein